MRDRADWTAYAERQGLVRSLQPVVTNAPNKYHAEPTMVDGRRFASKREAARFLELQTQQHAGAIDELEVHPVFPLVVNGRYIGRYTGDFRYRNCQTGTMTIEDVKSAPTAKLEAFRLRKKLTEALYDVVIVCV